MSRKKSNKKLSRRKISFQKISDEYTPDDFHRKPDFHRMEFHRHGMSLVPDPADRNPGITFLLKGIDKEHDALYCSCSKTGKKLCVHKTLLLELYHGFREYTGGRTPNEDFRTSIWYRMAEILSQDCEDTPYNVKLQSVSHHDKQDIRIINSRDEELVLYYSTKSDFIRFLERFHHSQDENSIPSRGMLLKNLTELTISKEEQIMAEHGMKSIGQELESSIWYRLGYHCYREFGHNTTVFHPSIDENTGRFTISCRSTEDISLFRMVIPRQKVEILLRVFKDIFPNHHGLTIRPIPLKSIFKVSMNTELDLEIRPLIQIGRAS